MTTEEKLVDNTEYIVILHPQSEIIRPGDPLMITRHPEGGSCLTRATRGAVIAAEAVSSSCTQGETRYVYCKSWPVPRDDKSFLPTPREAIAMAAASMAGRSVVDDAKEDGRRLVTMSGSICGVLGLTANRQMMDLCGLPEGHEGDHKMRGDL
jgi:hypothetical protein